MYCSWLNWCGKLTTFPFWKILLFFESWLTTLAKPFLLPLWLLLLLLRAGSHFLLTASLPPLGSIHLYGFTFVVYLLMTPKFLVLEQIFILRSTPMCLTDTLRSPLEASCRTPSAAKSSPSKKSQDYAHVSIHPPPPRLWISLYSILATAPTQGSCLKPRTHLWSCLPLTTSIHRIYKPCGFSSQTLSLFYRELLKTQIGSCGSSATWWDENP